MRKLKAYGLRKISGLIVEDSASGRKNVYTAMICTSGDPVIVGRELPRRHAWEILKAIAFAVEGWWYGDRISLIRQLDRWGIPKYSQEKKTCDPYPATQERLLPSAKSPKKSRTPH